jgi:large subunit ribosomal protein L17
VEYTVRHLKTTKHLNRTASHRKALAGNLAAAVIERKRIITTLAKAKWCRSRLERFITFAKQGDIASRRHVLRYLRDKEVVKILFGEIADKYRDRPGGYTRVMKMGVRKGDSAPLAILELVDYEEAIISEKVRRQEAKKAAKEKKKEELRKKAEAPKMSENPPTPRE